MHPIPDKQSVPFAKRVFSAEVEQMMRNNADMKEAKLVKHCAVPFCIFQIMADEQHSGEISPVGDQCESAVGDQGKPD